MMKNLRVLAVTVFVGLIGLGSAGKVLASEGTIELTNQIGGQTRCWAASVLLRGFDYKIVLSCRDLIYPASADVFNYILWGREIGSDEDFRLGNVGVGKGEYSTNKPFSALFVTQERSSEPRSPSGRVVMSGMVKQIPILEEQPQTQTTQQQPELTESENKFLTGAEEPSPTPDTSEVTKNAFSIFRIVIGVFVVIVVLVIIVGVVSASRRRPIE